MSPPAAGLPPCVLHEDEHLLVVNKPAGWNTHAPAPFAGEGIYDWLRAREPRWASLAIVHRLDKETSGVMVFGKTPLANRSLTQQFEQRKVEKVYVLLTDRQPARDSLVVKSAIVKAGAKYLARRTHSVENFAETSFRVVRRESGRYLVESVPKTGRTHQLRVHAAESGFPILGDVLYGGTPAARVCLHAEAISFAHPASGERVTFRVAADFEADARLALRGAFIGPCDTDAYRMVHGAADGHAGWFVDRLGDFLLATSEEPLDESHRSLLSRWLEETGTRGVYEKRLVRRIHGGGETSPQWVMGAKAPDVFDVRENGLRFGLSFNEGYSVGLFLDQRDNRRRLLTGNIASDFSFRIPHSEFRILNTFAYTCAFSVCAARGGARVTSVDLSKKYLEWGRRNFASNGLDASAHEFLHGECHDWLRRLAKKGRVFDAVLLDPPTFSRSKSAGTFAAEKDYAALVSLALPVLKPGGVLFASTNAASLSPEDFLEEVRGAVARTRRKITAEHFAPQPPDFPVTREQPAHLKTVWMRVA